LALLGLGAVERFQVRREQPCHGERLAAARLAREAMEVVRRERLRRGPPIDPEADPAGSGLIGPLLSPITTKVGHLPAKQTSVNPNFAAVVVHELGRAGVREKDVVAISLSGSFPAINIAVLAAVESLGLQPVLVSGVTGSQFGANAPDFTWLDMERLLAEEGVFDTRSVAASPGGIEDRALGLSEEHRQLVLEAIERSGIPVLRPRDYAESVQRRWDLFHEAAGHQPISAFVNVGGGTSSVGARDGKRLFRPGLNRTAPAGASRFDSVMTRFVREGVPVIHLVRMRSLAERFGLPLQPSTLPAVGEGAVYVREERSALLTWGVLLGILACLYFSRRPTATR